MKRRLFSLFMAVCMVTGLLATTTADTETVRAQENTTVRTADADWTAVDVDGGVKLVYYRGSDTELVVPEMYNDKTVVTLSADHFPKSGIISLTLPGTVKTVPSRLLFNAKQLQKAVFLEGVEVLGESVFANCEALTEVTLPNSMTEIGISAFYGCSSLERLMIPEGVANIKRNAFAKCPKLTDITVDERNTSYAVADGVLYSKDMTELVYWPTDLPFTEIPNTVTKIASGAFYRHPGVTKLIIPEGVTQIGAEAFLGCTNMTELFLPDTLRTIEMDAFRGCTGLTELVLPQSLQEIGRDAFMQCSGITSVEVPDGVELLASQAFSYCTELVAVRLPKSLKAIEDCVFYGCRKLENLIIPEGTVSLKQYMLQDGPSRGYVVIPESVTSLTTTTADFWGNSQRKYCCYAGSAAEQFAIDNEIPYLLIGQDCYVSGDFIYAVTNEGTAKLLAYAGTDSKLVIPGEIDGRKVTDFGELGSGQENRFITSITFPEGILKIGFEFWKFENLSTVYIPASVTEIDGGAFSSALNLTIKGKEGSYAQTYAMENEIPWEIWEEASSPGETETPDTQAPSPGDSETPSGSEIPRDSQTLGTERPAPGTTETPETQAPSPGNSETNVPGDSEIPKDSQTLGTEMPTPGTTETPETQAPSPGNSETFSPGDSEIPKNSETSGTERPMPGTTETPETQVPSPGNSETFSPGNSEIPKNSETLETERPAPGTTETPDTQAPSPGNSETLSPGDSEIPKNSETLGTERPAPGTTETPDTEVASSEHIHNYSMTVTREATCAREGERTFVCSGCGASYTEPISMAEHRYQEVLVQATPQTAGYRGKICAVCSDRKDVTEILRPQKVVLSKKDYTYNGKVKKPTVVVKDSGGKVLQAGADYRVSYPNGAKNPGVYKVTVQLQGKYSGALNGTYMIRPKGTQIKALAAKKKGILAVWKKQKKQVDGYQIQCCIGGEFKGKTLKTVNCQGSSTETKKISGLKGKQKYYVRIRTYKKVIVDGEKRTLYSDWSNTKTVRAKK